MNWQSIETAPKDGTPILVYVPDGVELDEHIYAWPEGSVLHIWPACWKEPNRRSHDGPGWFIPMCYLAFGPWDDPCHDLNAAEVAPTHWMTLDPPITPSAAAACSR